MCACLTQKPREGECESTVGYCVSAVAADRLQEVHCKASLPPAHHCGSQSDTRLHTCATPGRQLYLCMHSFSLCPASVHLYSLSSLPAAFSPITRARPDSPRHYPAGGLALLRIVLAGTGSGGDWASRGGADASTDRLRQTCTAQSKPVPIFGSGKDLVISYCHCRLKHHEAPDHCSCSPHGKPALTCSVGINLSAAASNPLPPLPAALSPAARHII